MIENLNRQAFLIVTQEISKPVIRLYQNLQAAASERGDVFILYHQKNEPVPSLPSGVKVKTFTNGLLRDLNYQPIRTRFVPGSNHFPVLDFYLRHPNYQHYWCIEDDVTFNGNWRNMFDIVEQGVEYDFITSHIRRYSDYPDWFWWDSYRVPGQDFHTDLISSFNPIYRISAGALQHIDKCLKSGYRGHHEVLLPTVLRKDGFKLADFATQENHVTPTLGLCTLATMRWKPVFFKPGTLKNHIYHPVKANINFSQFLDYIERTIRKKKEYMK